MELDFKVYLWKNLYRAHKLNSACLSTNPFYNLERMKSIKRVCRTLKNGKDATITNTEDPLKDISVTDWKDACLKYGKFLI
jgi:hypothetical protein